MYLPSDHSVLVEFANTIKPKFDINVRDFEFLVILACENNRQDILDYILVSKSIPFSKERLTSLKNLKKNTKMLKKLKNNKRLKETITITFGDVAENSVGMEKIGVEKDDGHTYLDLVDIQNNFNELGCKSEIYDMSELLDLQYKEKVENGYILIIRNGIVGLKEDCKELKMEQKKLLWDTKAFMRGRVVNKLARHNICFANYEQEPDYANGKGRIINFQNMKHLNNFKTKIEHISKRNELVGEGNLYYDINKCGIGFHGDAERNIVIALRLGETMPLCFQWYYKTKAQGKMLSININEGDIYFMSKKAVGKDWKKRNTFTLRHSAGCEKYTGEIKNDFVIPSHS